MMAAHLVAVDVEMTLVVDEPLVEELKLKNVFVQNYKYICPQL